MMQRTSCLKMMQGTHRNWPWPTKLPLKDNWYHKLPRDQSISQEVRSVNIVGDLCILSLVGYAAYRVYTQHVNGEQQTHLHHLTGHPPAIIAQNFDFQNPDNNRKVSRATLDEYRNEYAGARAAGESFESVIFRF